jgi:hypothetical protein
MNDEDQLNRKFEELDFSDEPAMASQPEDDIRRGERRLRRRRTLVVTAGLAAGVVMATGAVAVLPNALRGDATLQVAGGDQTSSPTASPPTAPTPSAIPTPTTSPRQSTQTTPTAPADDPFPYPVTRQLLLEAAVRHLDPKREHLPKQSTNAQTGGASVGSKLDWTVRGEDGMGMIKVVVTEPDYKTEEHGLEWLMGEIGCLDNSTGETRCERRPIPGTSEQAWVADSGVDSELSVLYERTDGSYVGIGVYDLFGNNTTTPVSKVDVSLEQAFAFVTDPGLKVVPGDDPGDVATR